MVTSKQVLDIASYAGEIILANGAEIYRVEETINKICQAYDIKYVESFVTPTGFFLSIDDGEYIHTVTKRIHQRSINLNKIQLINQFSRDLQKEPLNYETALTKLHDIKNTEATYNFFTVLILTSLASAMYVILTNANYFNLIPAFLGSFSSQLIIKQSGFLKNINYIPEVTAGFIGGVVALIFNSFQPIYNLSVITVSSILPFVPGFSATNAIRDAINGDLISATSRGVEVILTSISLAAGVALSLGVVNI